MITPADCPPPSLPSSPFLEQVIAALDNDTASGSLASAALLSSADLLLLDINGRAAYHGPGESLREGLEDNGLSLNWCGRICPCSSLWGICSIVSPSVAMEKCSHITSSLVILVDP